MATQPDQKKPAPKPPAKKQIPPKAKEIATKWIAGATSKNKGKFSAKAKAAGKSTQAYASQVTAKGSTADATTKKEASLAKTLSKMNKGKKKK